MPTEEKTEVWDVDYAIGRAMESDLRIVDDRYTTANSWRMVEAKGDRYRVPETLGFADALLILDGKVGLADRDDALDDFLDGTAYHLRDYPYTTESDGMASAALPLIDGAATCEALAQAVRDAVTAWTDELDRWVPDLPAYSSEAVGAVLDQADMFGDMEPTRALRDRAKEALEAAYKMHRELAYLAFTRGKEARIAEFERDRDARMAEIKRDVIDHVVKHSYEYRTEDAAAPVNPVAHHLAKAAGLTLDEIAEAYGVSRQGASHYVNGARHAPKLHGEKLRHFLTTLKGYRVEAAARLAALEKVIGDGIT